MRSKLFVSGSRPDLFQKALEGPADAISIDLEDAVLEERKDEARMQVSAFLRDAGAGGESSEATDGSPAPGPRKLVIVRVNGAATRHHAADLDAVAWPRLDVVNLPKVEDPESVAATARTIGWLEHERGIKRPIRFLLNIESPRGLRRAAELASADPRVMGLQVGLGDLFEPLRIDRRDPTAAAAVLLAVRFAAAEAGVPAFDGAWVDVGDEDGLRREAARARRLGFAGKSCIHPSQVDAVNQAFTASAEEIAFAHRVLAAWEEAEARGLGAIMVDGRVVDKLLVARARSVLADQAAAAA